MNKSSSRLVLSIQTILILLIATGCVSQGKYEDLAKERDELEKQNRALQASVKLERNQKATTEQNLQATEQMLSVTSEKLAETTVKAMSNEALYNKLVGKLAAELDSKQITIQQMQSGVNVNLPEGILFESGSSEVKTEGQLVLHKVAKELWDVPFQTIVGGFTDNVPISKNLQKQFPTNWDLAAARATNVVRMLQESGVPQERLVVVSFGENQPVASNDSTEGRAQNRRIEIRLRPVIVE